MDQTDLCLLLIPALPLAAAILVALLGPKLLKEQSHWVLIIALAGSFLSSLGLVNAVYRNQSSPAASIAPTDLSRAGYERVITLWTWVNIPQVYDYVQPASPVED